MGCLRRWLQRRQIAARRITFSSSHTYVGSGRFFTFLVAVSSHSGMPDASGSGAKMGQIIRPSMPTQANSCAFPLCKKALKSLFSGDWAPFLVNTPAQSVCVRKDQTFGALQRVIWLAIVKPAMVQAFSPSCRRGARQAVWLSAAHFPTMPPLCSAIPEFHDECFQHGLFCQTAADLPTLW